MQETDEVLLFKRLFVKKLKRWKSRSLEEPRRERRRRRSFQLSTMKVTYFPINSSHEQRFFYIHTAFIFYLSNSSSYSKNLKVYFRRRRHDFCRFQYFRAFRQSSNTSKFERKFTDGCEMRYIYKLDLT